MVRGKDNTWEDLLFLASRESGIEATRLERVAAREREGEERGSSDEHRGAEELAHAEGPQHQPQLRVGLPRELEQKAEHTVPDEEHGRECARAVPSSRDGAALDHPEHEEQDDALGGCLVELRGMPGKVLRVRREHHRPGHHGGAPI